MSLPATRPRRYQKSGLYCRPTRLDDLPPEVAAVRRERRDALVAQLGGPNEVTPAQAQLVDLAVSASMQLDSVDAYLLTLPSLVDKRNHRVWQVVRDRAALSAHLQSLLRDIGVERRAGRVQSLEDYLVEKTALDTAANLRASGGASERVASEAKPHTGRQPSVVPS